MGRKRALPSREAPGPSTAAVPTMVFGNSLPNRT